jgi:hypothetical protein
MQLQVMIITQEYLQISDWFLASLNLHIASFDHIVTGWIDDFTRRFFTLVIMMLSYYYGWRQES